MPCATPKCTGVPKEGALCPLCTEVKRLRREAGNVRERVKEWRRRYGRAYNAGSNWENGQNYQTPGGTDNPIEGTLDAVRFLVAKKDVEGSDSGVVKFRYKHAGWGDILVHVKGKTK